MIKFAVTVIKTSPHYHCFDEILETIYYGIKALDYESIITDDLTLKDYQYIIFGDNLLSQTNISLPENSIIYNLEQIYSDSPWLKAGYIDYLLQYPILDYSLTNIEKLKQLGVKNIQHLPVGYVKELTRINSTENKNIDVLFYGSINDRRQKIIEELEKKEVNVKVLFGVYGEERDSYISRAKIVLNMHFYSAQVFEIVRVSYLLANRVFIISENGSNSEEEKIFNKGLVFTEYDNVVDTCLDYLTRNEDRKKIANQGLKIIQQYQESDYLKPVIATFKSSHHQPIKFIKDFYRKKLAKTYLENGQYHDAIQLYEETLQIDPNELESYWYLGLALLYNGDDFSSQLIWGHGISQGEEKGEDSEEIMQQFLTILQQEVDRQLNLNKQELANKIKGNIKKITS